MSKSLSPFIRAEEGSESETVRKITILPICDDYAPDTMAYEPLDRLVCTTCFWHKDDHQMIECPNHGGAFDCTPFCELCEGTQEIKVS